MVLVDASSHFVPYARPGGWPKISFLDARLKQIGKDQTHQSKTEAIIREMIAALKKSGRPVPKYMLAAVSKPNLVAKLWQKRRLNPEMEKVLVDSLEKLPVEYARLPMTFSQAVFVADLPADKRQEYLSPSQVLILKAIKNHQTEFEREQGYSNILPKKYSRLLRTQLWRITGLKPFVSYD